MFFFLYFRTLISKSQRTCECIVTEIKMNFTGIIMQNTGVPKQNMAAEKKISQFEKKGIWMILCSKKEMAFLSA